MKVLYYFCSEVMPLPDAIVDAFDRVVKDMNNLEDLHNSFSELTPDDTVVCSIHTCNGTEQVCDCANDCGIDIGLHLRKIDDKHKGSITSYQFNRDVAIPQKMQNCGYSRVYFGEEWDESPPPTKGA